jgi:hypothetical protein
VGTGPKGGKTWIFIGCVERAIDTPAGPVMVVDVAAMEQKVEIDAAYMAAEIEKTGRVAVHGIHFANGKADITPDSANVLAEIGSLLARRPDWRFRGTHRQRRECDVEQGSLRQASPVGEGLARIEGWRETRAARDPGLRRCQAGRRQRDRGGEGKEPAGGAGEAVGGRRHGIRLGKPQSQKGLP